MYKVGLNQWGLIVDAENGKVIKQAERLCRASGLGKVYLKYPVNSSLMTATILRLLGSGTTVDGTYIKVTNYELGDITNGNFQYYPPYNSQHDGTHFDDVNVYWHVDRFAKNYWIDKIGYNISFKVTAFVHRWYYGHDYALADWDTDELWFGHGEYLFWDLAKKDDVIYHEYTHIISHKLGLTPSNFDYPNETFALHEGYSDYHAASFSGNPDIGEWVVRAYPEMRTLSTSPAEFNYNLYDIVSYPDIYPPEANEYNPQGSPHANSMIWSGALWDLRNALGATVTDKLVYKGLTFIHGSSTEFIDARDGLIIADYSLYGGTHTSTIYSIMSARGIGSLSKNSHNNLALRNNNIPDTFVLGQNYPNPFNPETIINFSLPVNSYTKLIISDILGQEVIKLIEGNLTAGYHQKVWTGKDTEGNKVGSGIYLYRLTAQGLDGKEYTRIKKMVLMK